MGRSREALPSPPHPHPDTPAAAGPPAVLVAQRLEQPRAEARARPAAEAVDEQQPVDAVLKRLRLRPHGVERAVQERRRAPRDGAPRLRADRCAVRRDAGVLQGDSM